MLHWGEYDYTFSMRKQGMSIIAIGKNNGCVTKGTKCWGECYIRMEGAWCLIDVAVMLDMKKDHVKKVTIFLNLMWSLTSYRLGRWPYYNNNPPPGKRNCEYQWNSVKDLIAVVLFFSYRLYISPFFWIQYQHWFYEFP